MIPSSHALVPSHSQRRAAMQAIGYVEGRREDFLRMSKYPYASAFFRFLGCSTIGLSEIRIVDACFDPSYRRRATKERYIAAIDLMISSRGASCPLPLSDGVGRGLFPEIDNMARQRGEQRAVLKASRNKNVAARVEALKRQQYENQLSQAEIELAFCTPSMVSSWYANWSRKDLHLYDLSQLVCQWISRFPSLKHFDRYYLRSEPLWAVIMEINFNAVEQKEFEAYLDRLMLPNRLENKIKKKR